MNRTAISHKTDICRIIDSQDYYKGLYYNENYVKYIEDAEINNNLIRHYFEVESERTYQYYEASIDSNYNGEIVNINCNCPQFKSHGSCKHIGAILCNYYDKLTEKVDTRTKEELELDLSEDILNLFYTEKKERKVKKQIILDITLTFYQRYYSERFIQVDLKIGTDRLYSLNNKMNGFINAYKGQTKEMKFGKNFTYDKDSTYFLKEDEKIINFFANKAYKRYNDEYYFEARHFNIEQNEMSDFLDLLKEKKFNFENENKIINGIIEENPFSTQVTKDDKGRYVFKLELDEKKPMGFLDTKNEYVYTEGKVYKIDDKTSKIVSTMLNNNLDRLVIKNESLEKFTRGILPSFKQNLKIDDNIDDIVISSTPIPKLYFDLLAGRVVCNLKFDYDGNIVDYFSKDSKVLREYSYEDEVLDDILKYNFINENEKIFIDELDSIGNFIENDLKELTLKYDTYTSAKLKETNILKNTKVSSQFSIGQDNIMSYNFNIDGIDTDELNKIFDSMKQNKKYYKLKSGDFIDIEENDELKQLQNLVDDMEISSSDLKKGKGVIPKYRAIYLDSLRNEKYGIIETNNLFDELIDKFKKYKDAKIDLSKKDLEILRDYQVVGVKWLTNLHRCGLGGILADEMGLGKSIQVIYFIKQILKEKKDAKILIVSPTSLVYNWQNEFDKFGSELNYQVIAENKAKRLEDLSNIDKTNIIITTYGLLRQDKEIYNEMNFDLCVIDEAQNIKNINTQITKTVKEVKATTKIALSGTPIENSVLELWSIFDFVMPGYLSNLTKFRSKYNVKDVTKEDLKVFDDLNKQISAFILRRKKSDVILELPDKIENNIYLDLYPEQKKLYMAQVKKTREEMDKIIEEEGFTKASFKILQLLTRLRQLCIDPKIMFENYKGGSTKIDNLVSLVKDIIENGHKILIFTSFKTALNIVKTEFNNNNISSYVIEGGLSAKKRMELVDKFNSDDTNVFLIMLKAGGTGLNLTSADVVIHLDLWWNPQVENQATDRAHRIGQKNTVEVIKLICKGTIEERIVELQNKKKILSDSLIDGEHRDENILSKLSEKELKELIAYDNEDDE